MINILIASLGCICTLLLLAATKQSRAMFCIGACTAWCVSSGIAWWHLLLFLAGLILGPVLILLVLIAIGSWIAAGESDTNGDPERDAGINPTPISVDQRRLAVNSLDSHA